MKRGRVIAIRILVGAAVGVPLGLGAYAFIYAQGHSYLRDDPVACVNCHIMRDQFASWSRSGHHHAATCNACHTPGNLAQKYLAKADNGFWHSFAFTAQNFHEPIRIKPRNLRAVERACAGCHADVHAPGKLIETGERSCTRCHTQAGHVR